MGGFLWTPRISSDTHRHPDGGGRKLEQLVELPVSFLDPKAGRLHPTALSDSACLLERLMSEGWRVLCVRIHSLEHPRVFILHEDARSTSMMCG